MTGAPVAGGHATGGRARGEVTPDGGADGPVAELLPSLRAFAIPMRTRFRGITVREGALIQGPAAGHGYPGHRRRGHGRRGNLAKSGRRFSLNASRPSWASSLM